MAHLKGDIRILYIKDSGTYLPIGCLTSNPLSESTETIQVPTKIAGGWDTPEPLGQSFSIEFSGLQVLTGAGGDTTKLSYDTLRTKKRARALVEWRISDASLNFIDEGKGYINAISEGNEIGNFLTFSGSILGYGIPVFSSEAGAKMFQDGELFIFQDGQSFIFN